MVIEVYNLGANHNYNKCGVKRPLPLSSLRIAFLRGRLFYNNLLAVDHINTSVQSFPQFTLFCYRDGLYQTSVNSIDMGNGGDGVCCTGHLDTCVTAIRNKDNRSRFSFLRCFPPAFRKASLYSSTLVNACRSREARLVNL